MAPLAVSVQEAAEMLGVSVFTVRRNIRKGLLRAVRIGRRVVVPVESLRALLGTAGSLRVEDTRSARPSGQN
jgi:excisionase family DNA binding protein